MIGIFDKPADCKFADPMEYIALRKKAFTITVSFMLHFNAEEHLAEHIKNVRFVLFTNALITASFRSNKIWSNNSKKEPRFLV